MRAQVVREEGRALFEAADSIGNVRSVRLFDADGRLQCRASFGYLSFGGRDYCTGDTLEVFRSGGSDVFTGSVRYASDSLHHYPAELTRRRGDGPVERTTYTYPFCAPPAYGPVADSLLRRGMPDAVLSVAYWKDDALVDSVSVLYGRFLVQGAEDGHLFRPSAVVAARGDAPADTCFRYLSYDSLGVRPLRVQNSLRRESRSLGSRLSRWEVPDPELWHRRKLDAFYFCGHTPGLSVDPAGDSFLFGPDGSFLARVHYGQASGKIVFIQDGDPLLAGFADPEGDPKFIDYNTKVELAAPESVASDLERAGALDVGNQGFFRGMCYLARHSRYGGRLDFAANGCHDIFSDVFYITKTDPEGLVAHNRFNYGNFLWGATAHQLRVPLFIARLGSHIDSFFLSSSTRGSFDTPDDIFSICAGYHWQ